MDPFQETGALLFLEINMLYHRALLEEECQMTKTQKKAKKKYEHLTKAILLPDGTCKYFRAKTQKELNEKVMKAQILVNSGVDICSEETFGHFAQMWYDRRTRGNGTFRCRRSLWHG